MRHQRARNTSSLIHVHFLPFLVHQPRTPTCPQRALGPPASLGRWRGWASRWIRLLLGQAHIDLRSKPARQRPQLPLSSEGKWGPQRFTLPMKKSSMAGKDWNAWSREAFILSLILCLPATCQVCLKLNLTSVTSEP